jgi:hypothetical protein
MVVHYNARNKAGSYQQQWRKMNRMEIGFKE